MRLVRQVVILADGEGSRFAPMSMVIPKAMLPILNKPVVHLVTEQALLAGATNLIVVISRSDELVEGYFKRLRIRARRGGSDVPAWFAKRLLRCSIEFAYQRHANGTADALQAARPFLGDYPFGLLLGDIIFTGRMPVLDQLWTVHSSHNASCIAVHRVAADRVSSVGIVEGAYYGPRLVRCATCIEKPRNHQTSSRLAITGAYVLQPEIHLMIDHLGPGFGGELQLTDALDMLCKSGLVLGVRTLGRSYSTGDPRSWLLANLAYSKFTAA